MKRHLPRRLLVAPCLAVLLAGCSGAGDAQSVADAADANADVTLDDASAGDDVGYGDDVGPGDAAAEDDGAGAVCPPPAVPPGEVRVRVVECEAELPSGPFAVGQVGDVVLSNSMARFVVRTRLEGHALSGLTGGHLVDAVRVDQDGVQIREDGLRELALAVDFWMLRPDAWEITDAGAGGQGVMRVTGSLQPFPLLQGVINLPEPQIEVVHEYIIAPDAPVVEVRTTLTPRPPAHEPSVTLADVAFWSGEVGLFLPGLGADELPISAAADLMAQLPLLADPQVVGYATARPETGSIINASGITAFAWSDGFVPDDGLVLRRYLAVGSASGALDLAGAMSEAGSHVGAETRAVSGVVVGAFDGVQLEARDADGAPLTRCAVQVADSGAGTFACEVPLETEALVAVWVGDGHGELGAERQTLSGSAPEVAVPAGTEAASGLSLDVEAPARLEVAVRDGDGQPIPFRLTLSTQLDGEGVRITRHELDGEGAWLLREGTWDLWVHHGPFYEQYEAVVALASGQTTRLDDVVLARAVDSTGWIGGDLHVHSETSTDSHTPLVQRLRSAVAEDLGYMVTTDHDFVTDAALWAERAGVEGRLLVDAGVEVSTTDWGHFNVWPLVPDRELSGQGAPVWFGLDALDLLALLRATGGVVQCNHPRFKGAGFFDSIGLEPEDTPADLLGFDVMEIINGIAHDDTPAVLEDWLALLSAGHRIVVTGTSDTHGTNDFMGNPRTMIAVAGAGEAAEISASAVRQALIEGRAVATAGPMLAVEVTDSSGASAGIGDTMVTTDTTVSASVTVQAPSWMALGTLQIYGPAGLLLEADLGAGEAPTAAVSLDVDDADGAWLVAVHRPTGGSSKPGIHRPPWAVSNPVWVTR